jgi:hypothetical protein
MTPVAAWNAGPSRQERVEVFVELGRYAARGGG